MAIQESGEMYLETILILSQEKDIIHATDIAEKMNFSKPSVSRGTSILKDNGLITIDKANGIKLTECGLDLAKKIYEKHVFLTKYLTKIGVNPKTAEEDACRIEHILSDESYKALIKQFEEMNQ